MPPKNKSTGLGGLNRPTIFAHRGSSAHAPENTLAAFELAIEHWADGIELDVKLSADGHVMVMHDYTVDRTTDGTGWVNTLTLNELKQLDAGSKHPPQYKRQSVPTLEEVFEAVGGKIFINVELTNYTSPSDDLPDRAVALVEKFGLKDKVMFSSFNIMALMRARHLLPTIPLGYLTHAGEALLVLHSKMIRFGPLVALNPASFDVTPELLHNAHQARTRVYTYTVDQPDEMKQLFSLGVDGIFTNDPLLARQVLSDFSIKTS